MSRKGFPYCDYSLSGHFSCFMWLITSEKKDASSVSRHLPSHLFSSSIFFHLRLNFVNFVFEKMKEKLSPLKTLTKRKFIWHNQREWTTSISKWSKSRVNEDCRKRKWHQFYRLKILNEAGFCNTHMEKVCFLAADMAKLGIKFRTLLHKI